MKVWIDGAIIDGSEARISVFDHGFLYGDGIFEGMRAYNGRMFRLDDHMRRLGVSARAIGLELPGGAAAIRDIVLETVASTGASDAYIRLLVTRGQGPLGVDPTTCENPRVICIVDTVELFPADKAAKGVDLATASMRRPGADVLDPRVKSLNYLNNVMAKLEAKRRGADDALLLNAAGNVSEASGANIFAVCRGVLTTPAVTDGVLEGITRMTVLELADVLGIPARERTMGRIDLFGASEAFLTGSGARIVPVRSLDTEQIGEVTPGPITTRLRDAFFEFARSNGTPIPYPGRVAVA
ncbi:MAG: branched-chain-amino-acid transaminase [Deltaproteobacteria bacterium]|nr:branched-chain-amino-acid transaminase [Deltaproteobacteria bacterium]